MPKALSVAAKPYSIVLHAGRTGPLALTAEVHVRVILSPLHP